MSPSPKHPKSALAASLLTPSDTQKGPRCRVSAILAELDASDPAAGDALRRALALSNATMPSTVIKRRLAAADPPIKVSTDVLQRHRRHDCACPI